MAIIGISGKLQSGKNTIARIINQLTNNKYQEKSFAGKLKQIVSILTGIPVEDLEKQEVKNRVLGKEWTRYGYADGFKHIYEDGVKTTVMINKECSKERYEEELKTNWQTAYEHKFTPRELLQFIGTDLFRNKLLENIWVNALFADYNCSCGHNLNNNDEISHVEFESCIKPNWIITDMRFLNELKAVKNKRGITIRVNRNKTKIAKHDGKLVSISTTQEHRSETALDNAEFDYTIDNNGTIDELIEKVKIILQKEQII